MDELLMQMLRQNVDERMESAVQVRKALNQLRASSVQRMPMHAWLDSIFNEEEPTGAFVMPLSTPGPTWKLSGSQMTQSGSNSRSAKTMLPSNTTTHGSVFWTRGNRGWIGDGSTGRFARGLSERTGWSWKPVSPMK